VARPWGEPVLLDVQGVDAGTHGLAGFGGGIGSGGFVVGIGRLGVFQFASVPLAACGEQAEEDGYDEGESG